ncbi:MAG: substrate-binding domain-containing protein [Thaumarchaeota archaeon]|nr:substrate-binding domain-containing protein [Nitrososphaerota archaeon]
MTEEKKISRRKFLYLGVGAAIAVAAGATAAYYFGGRGWQPPKKKVIALNVGAYGWPWRTQHMEDFKSEAEKMKKAGIIDGYVVRASGPDIAAQAADIRSLADMNIPVIIVNPNSPSGLNEAIKYAHDRGSIVIATDQYVTSPYAINVVINQEAWFADEAKWVCEQLNGEGNIVIIDGYPGHPANEDRIRGAHRVLGNYPKINVLAEVPGWWNYDKTEEAFAPILASFRGEIDGLLLQDSMIQGVLRAYDQAGIKPGDPDFPKVTTADYRMDFLKNVWTKLRAAGVKVYQRLNPPGCSVSALKIAIRLLEGRELDYSNPKVDTKTHPGPTVWLPMPPAITNENLDDWINKYKDKPDDYQIDYWISDEEADSYFKS